MRPLRLLAIVGITLTAYFAIYWAGWNMGDRLASPGRLRPAWMGAVTAVVACIALYPGSRAAFHEVARSFPPELRAALRLPPLPPPPTDEADYAD